MNGIKDPVIPQVATVAPETVTTFSKEVLDAPVKKKRGPYKKREKKVEPELHTDIKVHPEVWAMAKQTCRKGEHLVIIDENTVVTEYDSGLVARIVS